MGSMRRLQLLPLVFSLQSGWGMEKFHQRVTGQVYRVYNWLNKFKPVSLHASNTNVTIFLTRAARQSQSTEGRSQSPCHTSKVSKPSAILSDAPVVRCKQCVLILKVHVFLIGQNDFKPFDSNARKYLIMASKMQLSINK